jgi:hypothetical protein
MMCVIQGGLNRFLMASRAVAVPEMPRSSHCRCLTASAHDPKGMARRGAHCPRLLQFPKKTKGLEWRVGASLLPGLPSASGSGRPCAFDNAIERTLLGPGLRGHGQQSSCFQASACKQGKLQRSPAVAESHAPYRNPRRPTLLSYGRQAAKAQHNPIIRE